MPVVLQLSFSSQRSLDGLPYEVWNIDFQGLSESLNGCEIAHINLTCEKGRYDSSRDIRFLGKRLWCERKLSQKRLDSSWQMRRSQETAGVCAPKFSLIFLTSRLHESFSRFQPIKCHVPSQCCRFATRPNLFGAERISHRRLGHRRQQSQVPDCEIAIIFAFEIPAPGGHVDHMTTSAVR